MIHKEDEEGKQAVREAVAAILEHPHPFVLMYLTPSDHNPDGVSVKIMCSDPALLNVMSEHLQEVANHTFHGDDAYGRPS